MERVKRQWLGIVLFLAAAISMHAQLPGGGGLAPSTPQFSAAFSKLFGEHKAFSADMDMAMTEQGSKEGLSTPAKIWYLEGKSRLEIDLTRAKGPQLPAGMGEQLKAMGMGDMTMISQEGKTSSYLVYPSLQAYAVIATPNNKEQDESKIKLDSTELGKDTIDGQACIKNRVIITEGDGTKSEATVWNATQLKKFPVRIETAKDNTKVQMTFRNAKLAKPDTKLFEPPANYKKHENVQSMMQEAIMKSIQGGAK
ncbi:MAG TPA: hypothetical protein VJ063_07475 [Verrucomicrobiae bacterium]|nr:hypothetical protein [Verrucomicrobiae bacterium]